MGEQPFKVGDVIRVGDVTGEVYAIDALSVRLRSFDNLMVRIPNEAMLKSNLTNVSHFPIRRLDMKISVAYTEDIAEVRRVLEAVAERNPVCFSEPKPVVICLGFANSGIDLQFSVWATQKNYLALRNTHA